MFAGITPFGTFAVGLPAVCSSNGITVSVDKAFVVHGFALKHSPATTAVAVIVSINVFIFSIR